MQIDPTEWKPIIEQCDGCNRVTENDTCQAYLDPNAFWRKGHCPLATHVLLGDKKNQEGKARVGQQKQKKEKK